MVVLRAGLLDKKYPCSQKNLYQVLRLGLTEYMKRQALFQAVSGIYTEEWGDQQLAAVDAAELLPDFEAREGVHEVLRVQLLDFGKTSLINWMHLEGHIFKSFPAAEHKALLEMAGKNYYRKASKFDWESLSALLVSASTFIDENLAALTAGGMPVSFQDNFATAQLNFRTTYDQFKIADLETREIANTKIAANNQVYTTVTAMFKDAQKIFRNNAEVRQLFTFRIILANITGGQGAPSAAKIKATSNQKDSQRTMNIGFLIENGFDVTVDHGDNTSREITGDGVNTVFYDKTYILLKIFAIVISGAIFKILEIHLNHCNLTYIKLHKSMKNLRQFIAQDNMFTTAVVDDILITINKYGTSGPGRVINLLGSEPPSEAGLQAKAELEARGWVVLVAS